jgi:hypothetical protein
MIRKARITLYLALVLSFVFVAGSAFADCAAPWQISGATNRLKAATNNLQRVASEDTGYSELSGSVHQLARSVDRMEDSLGTGTDCDRIRDHFHNVADNYQEVHNMVRRDYAFNHDPRIMNSWDRVQDAFANTRQVVYGGPERHHENGGIYIHIPGLGHQ